MSRLLCSGACLPSTKRPCVVQVEDGFIAVATSDFAVIAALHEHAEWMRSPQRG